MRNFLLTISLFLCFLNSNAAVWTCTACPATWGASPYPFWNGATQLTSANLANGDVLDIPAGCTVSISGVVTMGSDIVLVLNGTLTFPTSGDKLNLTANSIILAGPSGKLVGVSNSNQIKIGSGGAEWSGPGTLNGPFIIANGFLPIELAAFTADFSQKAIHLNWKTLSETRNDHYEIEKSSDGVNFSKLTSVKTLAPDGNSRAPLEYSYTDNDVTSAIHYYRLKQIDKDGNAHLSNIISVEVHANDIKIYPNPNSGAFSIDVETAVPNSEIETSIYNSLGQLVYRTKTKGESKTIQINRKRQ